MRRTQPARGAVSGTRTRVFGRRAGSRTTRGSPWCASIMRSMVRAAAPDAIASVSFARASRAVRATPPSRSISTPSASVHATRSAGPPPRSTSSASRVSSALPTVRPSGPDMSVSSATTCLPDRVPTETSARASRSALATSFMNAPRPTFTSSTSASIPSASFFDRMLATMSGTHSMVAVTSRSAYMRLSAGAISAVWPIIEVPTSRTVRAKARASRSTRKPGMASSLSSVPPVWPRPRPETIGTFTPQAATSGARQSDTLSPTPPVECLSTLTPGTRDRSRTSPERSIACVSATVSASVMPRKKTAMRKAVIW